MFKQVVYQQLCAKKKRKALCDTLFSGQKNETKMLSNGIGGLELAFGVGVEEELKKNSTFNNIVNDSAGSGFVAKVNKQQEVLSVVSDNNRLLSKLQKRATAVQEAK